MAGEKRNEPRMRYDFEGLSVFDGALNEVKIEDVSSCGVGLLSMNELQEGRQGLLFARLPALEGRGQIPIEVRWCVPLPKTGGSQYRYRAGLQILETPAEKPETPE